MKVPFPLAPSPLPRLCVVAAVWLLSGCTASAPDADAVRLAIESHFERELQTLQHAAGDEGPELEAFEGLAYRVEITGVSECQPLADDAHWRCKVVGELEIDGERRSLDRVLELVHEGDEWHV
ncbi:hypothetical protein [Halotalea alkalilenta]|uniref:Uncharacterized protein n=1 Tax=Halotalea alkalilenta TaxID=376489 RepID=A0A172YCW4_9GAMM|nr:hypothetical protein [Halotalea alkalilenta]ANF57077.1 hypothetical protein A5892_06025 [Halotalea alkalilenta]